MDWAAWKIGQKTNKVEEYRSCQEGDDICTFSSNYECWPVFFSLLFTLPLAGQEAAQRQMAKWGGKCWNYTGRCNKTEQMDTVTRKENKKDNKTKPVLEEVAPEHESLIYLSLLSGIGSSSFILSVLLFLTPLFFLFCQISISGFKLYWWDKMTKNREKKKHFLIYPWIESQLVAVVWGSR